MKLTKINRSTGEELALNSKSLFGGDYQANLNILYQKFNVSCHCLSGQSVTMHIRRMQSSGLLFLADNPTSALHSEGCEFYTARKSRESLPGTENKIKPFKPTTEFSEKIIVGGSIKKTASTPSKAQPRNVMSALEGLFVTLMSNAFCEFNFGGFVSIKDVITRIKDNKDNAKITTGKSALVSNIYFGQKGIDYAKAKVKQTIAKPTVNEDQPIALWFGLVTEVGDDYVMLNEKRLSCNVVYLPHKASGPYLTMGTITRGCDTDFKQMLLTPVVSKSIVFPIYNELQREKTLELQKWLYGRNRSGKSRFYIQKPLKPIIDEGKKVLADLLVVSKDKGSGKKRALALSSKNFEHISSVYDCDALDIKQVDIALVRAYFSNEKA